MPSQKKVVSIKVQNLSGADMSHRNSGTLTCGTITPILVEEVIPATRCTLKPTIVVQLPPLVSDTYMNLKLKLEAFFCPMRLLSRSFENWFTTENKRVARYTSTTGTGTSATFLSSRAALPVIQFDNTVPTSVFGAGSLLDYLGFKVDQIQGNYEFSPLSVLCYHLIWQEYYRNPKVQNPAFVEDVGQVAALNPSAAVDAYRQRICSMIYQYFQYGVVPYNSAYPDNHTIPCNSTNISEFVLADGQSLFSLRQRNFGFDYFTSCRPSAQYGDAAQVTLALPSGATETNFTIAQLRAANSLQQFRERNGLPSPRLVDQVKARYGANLSDGIAQRPICIGSASYDVYTKGVDQTAPAGVGSQPNPFNSIGSQYGRAFGVGTDSLIDDFTANEPGFIMVLATLVPEVTYSSGVSAYLRRYIADGSVAEMANPLLQNIGDEPVYSDMLCGEVSSAATQVFGYNDRYGSFMYHPNEAHGEFRDGATLASFVLQRSFGVTPPVIGSNFLEIPKNYLDGVMATSVGLSSLSAWYDARMNWRISLPLKETSIPTLQDPAYEHGKTVNLVRNGQIF